MALIYRVACHLVCESSRTSNKRITYCDFLYTYLPVCHCVASRSARQCDSCLRIFGVCLVWSQIVIFNPLLHAPVRLPPYYQSIANVRPLKKGQLRR